MRDLLAAALSDRYAIERELGRGGMASVWLARDLRLDRPVAIKVLHPELAGAIGVDRFVREVRLAARLQHPGIVPVLDSGTLQGPGGADLPWYAMAYVPGESLRARLDRERQLPVEDALAITGQVADALVAAHHDGIIHRDIKPENILLSGGRAQVADFGIARALMETGGDRLTSTGMAVGTPAYMSPEQASADVVDARTDQYSLATVLYEMLAGETPFAGPTAQAIMARRAAGPPRPIHPVRPSVPADVEAALQRALAPVPADRFAGVMELVRAMSGTSGRSGTSGTSGTGGGGASRRRRPALLVGAVLLVAIALAAALRLGTSAEPTVPERSIAILPFANSSGNAADEPLFDGITDELIGALGAVRDLRVVGRTSVFALKGRALDARAIGDTLGVATVLEGSGRREGNRLKVRVQLLDARDGRVIWADAYDREVRAALAVQEEIARAIVTALRVQLGSAAAPLVRTATDDSAAYDLYLRGRYVLHTNLGPDGVRSAVGLFEDAIRRDSALAPAWSGLSDARARLAIFGFGEPLVEGPLARAAALRALALDSTLAAAYASLAHVQCIHELDWAGGERSFRRAMALDPGTTFGRLAFAICLSSQWKFAEAIAQVDSARASDPLAPAIPNVLGRVYVGAGQPDSAIRALREALSLDPNLDLAYQQLGHAYVQKGMYPEAIAALERAAALSGPRDSAHLAWAHAAAGHRDVAERILAQVLSRPERRGRLAVHLAQAYAALGDRDAAFALLEQSFRERSSFLNGIAVTPAFAPLHGDPRWEALLRRMGLRAGAPGHGGLP